MGRETREMFFFFFIEELNEENRLIERKKENLYDNYSFKVFLCLSFEAFDCHSSVLKRDLYVFGQVTTSRYS